ncbi:MAG: helix-hairpin-helix domain-containing protein [Candidatus Omnitrophica bacterium]|nr:helix-hairpin-helix domain-containing protein [Candidatus Omnitrophota bacterium]
MRKLYLFLRPKKGSILIVSLWALGVLAILGLALAQFIFQQIKFTNFFMRSTISLPVARAAYQRVLFERRTGLASDYDSLKEITGEKEEQLCNDVSYKYYFAQKKIIDGEEIFIDESALINLNLASSRILEQLPGLDEDLAKKIVESGKRPFKRKEELLLIEDIDKEQFIQFKDLITVYGTGKININSVSKEVLSALGLDDDLIEKIFRFRKEYEGGDGEEGTIDDGAFTSPSTIASELQKFVNLSTRQQQDLISLANTLDVKSEYIRLSIIPQIKGKDGVRYSIIMHPPTGKLISWSEQ